MKLAACMIAAILLGAVGWVVAQNADRPPTTAPPAPTETIRPDQGVAFPVDI